LVLNLKYHLIGFESEAGKVAEICLKCAVCCVVKEYGCPAHYGRKYNARDTYVYDVLSHQDPLENQGIWTCVSCHKCEEMCPYEVSPIKFIERSKQEAVKIGKAPPSIYEEIMQVITTSFAFPITSNTTRLRKKNNLPELVIIDELQVIAEKTGLSTILEDKR
jgi:heterodisulfide reductase subunit C